MTMIASRKEWSAPVLKKIDIDQITATTNLNAKANDGQAGKS